MVLNSGQFCSPGDICQCLDNIGLSQPWGMGTTGIYCTAASDDTKHLKMHSTAPCNKKLSVPKCTNSSK